MLLSVVLFYHILVTARKPPSEFLEKVLPTSPCFIACAILDFHPFLMARRFIRACLSPILLDCGERHVVHVRLCAKLSSITGTVMTRTPLEWTRVMEKSMESTLGAHASQPAWALREKRQAGCLRSQG